MSETLAEEEKQRIRVELMTEIAKNEQDLEQCNKETGRYGREFLYNIRDLEQLCTITECPLTSHELKEFGIFPKKKSLFNRAWTHVKDIVTKPHKAEEEAARIAREKAEFEERMNRFEEKQEEIAEQFKITKITKIFQDDQLRRSNEASLERERSVKEEFAERFKIVEEQVRRSEEAYVQRERIAREEAVDRFTIMEEQIRRLEDARIEREQIVSEEAERKNRENAADLEEERIEKAELQERIKIMEEQMRRLEDARIEREQIVSEEAERQNRERAAYLEKERIEKAELQERIRMMEEQMRRSEEARLEMERWIEKEKERKIKKKEEKRFREEEARIEKERAETEERERKEKKRIEKEEEDRKRKVVEERRLRIEADVKSLLALPYELRVQAYRDFDLEKRRELRINEELAEIELKTEYFCDSLWIEREEDLVKLINWIWSEEKWKKCYEVFIPISDIEKELEIMGKNSQFDNITYLAAKSEDRQITEGIKSLKAKKLTVDQNSSLNEFDLRSIVKNREQVLIWSDSAVTLNVLMWIYENMRDGQFELKKTKFFVPEEVRWSFLDKFGNFNRESLTFTGTNPNQKVREEDDGVIIEQGKLTIAVYKKKDEVDQLGAVGFHFDF